MARRGCASCTRAPVGAPPPLDRGGKLEFQTPGANAPRERRRLCDGGSGLAGKRRGGKRQRERADDGGRMLHGRLTRHRQMHIRVLAEQTQPMHFGRTNPTANFGRTNPPASFGRTKPTTESAGITSCSQEVPSSKAGFPLRCPCPSTPVFRARTRRGNEEGCADGSSVNRGRGPGRRARRRSRRRPYPPTPTTVIKCPLAERAFRCNLLYKRTGGTAAPGRPTNQHARPTRGRNREVASWRSAPPLARIRSPSS